MRDKQLNELFINLLRDKMHDDKKIAAILSEILAIQKEAIYRRLRNEVVFTFSEITQISYSLSISLDHIIGMDKDYYPYILRSVNNKEFRKDIHVVLNRYSDWAKSIIKEEENEISIVTLTIPIVFFFNYEYLLKWFLYNWDYRRYYQAGLLKKFEDFEFDPNILKLSKEVAALFKKIGHSCFILDKGFLKDFISDIKTLRVLKCVNEQDIEKMKNELLLFLDYLETIAISGYYPETGNKVSINISEIKPRSGFGYVRAGNYNVSFVQLFTFDAIISFSKKSFDDIYNWFKSYERTSTHISVSSEINRTTFFEEQRQILSDL